LDLGAAALHPSGQH